MITAALSGVVSAKVPGYMASEPSPRRERGRAAATVTAVDTGRLNERFGELVSRPETEIPLDEAALVIAAHARPTSTSPASSGGLDHLAERLLRPDPRRPRRLPVLGSRLRRQPARLLRPAQLLPRPGRDPPRRHPDHPRRAHHGRRPASRRPAGRCGHARPLPAARPGRPRTCSSIRSAADCCSTGPAAPRRSTPCTAPTPPSTTRTSLRSGPSRILTRAAGQPAQHLRRPRRPGRAGGRARAAQPAARHLGRGSRRAGRRPGRRPVASSTPPTSTTRPATQLGGSLGAEYRRNAERLRARLN